MAGEEAQLEREARRLVRRLFASGWQIHSEGDGYRLVAKGVRKGAVRRELVIWLQQRDLLQVSPDGKGFVLSASGRSWHQRAGEGGQAYRRQHQSLARRPDGTLANMREDPLLWLLRRRGRDGRSLISRVAYEAGHRLQRDYLAASRVSGMVVDWSRASEKSTHATPHPPRAEQLLEARRRFEKAIEAMGADLADIAVEICCHGTGLEEAEKRLGWPRHSARVILRIALSRLARHYGLVS